MGRVGYAPGELAVANQGSLPNPACRVTVPSGATFAVRDLAKPTQAQSDAAILPISGSDLEGTTGEYGGLLAIHLQTLT